MILNMSGSAAALNFKVIGGTDQPASPKENTIWVNTDTAITSWAFCADQPESPSEGMVWIVVGRSSLVEFNALKKNTVQVYPLSAKQYVSGAWVDKTAKSYIGGAWVDWWDGSLLYSEGNEYTVGTGGWISEAMGFSATYGGAAPTVARGASSMVITQGADMKGGIVRTANKIDLSRFSTLYFDGKLTYGASNTYCQLCIWSDLGTYMGDNLVAYLLANNTAGTVSIDVSALAESYYIGIFVFHTTSRADMNKMYLQ